MEAIPAQIIESRGSMLSYPMKHIISSADMSVITSKVGQLEHVVSIPSGIAFDGVIQPACYFTTLHPTLEDALASSSLI